jgi:hypothetical protein
MKRKNPKKAFRRYIKDSITNEIAMLSHESSKLIYTAASIEEQNEKFEKEVFDKMKLRIPPREIIEMDVVDRG